MTFTCRPRPWRARAAGERTVTATYTLDADGALTLTYRVDTDRPTYANITNHTYFNLAGHAAGSVRDQRVAVHAVRYLPVREDSVSEGEIAPVKGTPFDLAAGAALGSGLDADDVQIERGHGYDHCLCVFGFEPGAAPRPALDAVDPASGRTLSICITHPGAHLYTGNWLGDGPALTKDGATYGRKRALPLNLSTTRRRAPSRVAATRLHARPPLRGVHRLPLRYSLAAKPVPPGTEKGRKPCQTSRKHPNSPVRERSLSRSSARPRRTPASSPSTPPAAPRSPATTPTTRAGHVIAGAVNVAVFGIAVANGTNKIRIADEGFPHL